MKLQKYMQFQEKNGISEEISWEYILVKNRGAGGKHMAEKTVYLLAMAGILMAIAGCIFGFIGQWILVALVWAGAFGCCMAAINFKNQEHNEVVDEKGEEDGK